MSPATYQNALEAAIALAQSPLLNRYPQTQAAQAALLAAIDDGEAVLSPAGARVKSPTYAISRWIQHAIKVAGCAHSTRLVFGFGLVNDGGAL